MHSRVNIISLTRSKTIDLQHTLATSHLGEHFGHNSLDLHTAFLWHSLLMIALLVRTFELSKLLQLERAGGAGSP